MFFLRLDGELKGVADLEDVYASNCCVIAVWARIGKGTAMDWQAISAVGSLLCAAATFFAALVALMIGPRERKTSVCARGYFLEDKRFDLIEHHPNCFKIEFICDGSQPVYITHILEGARFRFCIRGMKCWFESKACCRKHGMYGRDLPNLKSRKYWALYPLRGVMKLEPGEIGRFTISFSKMRTVQEERKELGFFDLDAPLSLYAVDVSGKRYKIDSGASPNSFVERRTTKLIRVSQLTGKPLREKD